MYKQTTGPDWFSNPALFFTNRNEMIQSILKPFGIGVVAGMRSMMAPAVLSHKLSHAMPASEPHSLIEYAASPTTATVLKVLAAGELFGDKLPNTPARTDLPGLGFRILSGGTCGALISDAEGQPVVQGAVAGGLGAVIGCVCVYAAAPVDRRRTGIARSGCGSGRRCPDHCGWLAYRRPYPTRFRDSCFLTSPALRPEFPGSGRRRIARRASENRPSNGRPVPFW